MLRPRAELAGHVWRAQRLAEIVLDRSQHVKISKLNTIYMQSAPLTKTSASTILEDVLAGGRRRGVLPSFGRHPSYEW